MQRTTLRKLALVLAAYAAYSAILGLILLETAVGAFLARRCSDAFVFLGPPALLTLLPAEKPVSHYIIGTLFLAPLAYGLVVAKEKATRGWLFAGLVVVWLFCGSCVAAALS
mgnify:CR=1 FL=1